MKIVYLSNASFKGSGYLRISLPLMDEFYKLGHDIKFIGLEYNGEPHDHEYGIIPCNSLQHMVKMCQLLEGMYKPDWYVMALDIPYCDYIPQQLKALGINKPFAGIFPIESDPLPPTWGGKIASLDKGFCISEFGTVMAKQYNPTIEHLPMGISGFRILEDKTGLRERYNIPENSFVILTVAENQERKNLSAAMDIVRNAAKFVEKDIVYVLITKKELRVGWTIDDYWYETESDVDFRVVERGIPDEALMEYYNMADIFLITSKAEGWCMPITESIACGTPVIGGDHTGIREQIMGSQYGITVPEEYIHRDVWQNARRYYIDRKRATNTLVQIINGDLIINNDERETWLNSLAWDKSAKVLEKGLLDVSNA